MGRRGQSSRRSGSSSGRSSGGRGGNNRRGRTSSSNSNGMIIGGVVVVVVIVVALMMNSSGDETDNPKAKPNKDIASNLKKKSNLDTPVKKKASTKKSTKKRFDMAVLRPLAAKVDMGEWKKIDNYLSEAYKLKAQADAARKTGNEATYKALMTKAVDTWRKGDMASENFLFEIDGLHEDLWEACFSKQKTRLKNALKSFRGYLQYESK